MREDFRYDIQALRALAVLLVMLFHAYPNWIQGGFLGVDIFFVISGYVISKNILTNLERDEFSLLSFYERRIRRLFPALFVTTTITLLIAFFFWPQERVTAVVDSSLATLASIANIYFWLTSGYFDSDSIQKPLLHMWSLGVEEQFYLVFPVLLLLLMKAGLRFRYVVIATLIITTAAWSEKLLASDPDASFYLTPLRAFQFLCGSLVAFLPPIKSTPGRWTADCISSVIVGVLVILSCFVFTEESQLPGWGGLALSIMTALLILIAPHARVLQYVSGAKPVQMIGNASYSLYLAHWPITVYLSFFLAHLETLVIGTLALGLSFVAGAALFQFVEKPFRKMSLRLALLGPVGVSLFITIGLAIAHYGTIDAETEDTAVADAGSEVDSIYPRDITTSLIGDSHANMYRKPLWKYYSKAFQNPRTVHGCPALFGVQKRYTRHGLVERERTCNEHLLNLQNEVLDVQPEIVFIASRWDFYVADRPPNVNRPRQDFLFFPGDEEPLLSQESTRKTFRQAIKQTVDTLLSDKNRIVVLFGQPALQKTKTLDCASQNLQLNNVRAAEKCNATRESVATASARTASRTFAEIAEEYPDHVIYVDVLAKLCSSGICIVSKNQKLLYKDSDHLSAYGASWVLKEVASEIARIRADRAGQESF